MLSEVKTIIGAIHTRDHCILVKCTHCYEILITFKVIENNLKINIKKLEWWSFAARLKKKSDAVHFF